MTRCWLCGEPDDSCCACRTLDAEMAELLDADQVPGRPSGRDEQWDRATSSDDDWLSDAAVLSGRHGAVLRQTVDRPRGLAIGYPPEELERSDWTEPYPDHPSWSTGPDPRALRVCATMTVRDEAMVRSSGHPDRLWSRLHRSLDDEVNRTGATPLGRVMHQTDRDHARMTTTLTAWTWAVLPHETPLPERRVVDRDRPWPWDEEAAETTRRMMRDEMIAASVLDPQTARRLIGGTGA